MNNSYIIEICAASIQSAMAAQQGGAQRIELVDNLYEGGTTPSYAMIDIVRKTLQIDMMVMIRPRGGDFYYSDAEFSIMKEDIRICRELGVDGVVFGILESNGAVDVERCKILVEQAWPMNVTFHRAFDMTPDPIESLEDIIKTGAGRLLTAGQKNTAPEGMELIRKLIKQADDRIIVMPGSGISENNICEMRDETGAHEFHMTARKMIDSGMKFRKQGIFMGGLPQIPEFELPVADANRIRKIVNMVNS
jgi:copper homeostasis protein